MLATFITGLTAAALSHVALLLLLIKATIILVAAIGITMAMQRASAGARHLVWLVTLGTVLLVPVLAAWAPIRLRILPPETLTAAASTEMTSPTTTATAVPAANYLRNVDGSTTRIKVAPAPIPPSSSAVVTKLKSMSGLAIVFAIWLSVVLAVMASLDPIMGGVDK